MDTRKKACPNASCRTYMKKKFNANVNYCPECGTKLVYVCKAYGCFKPLDKNQLNDPRHKYCKEDESKHQQNIAKIQACLKKGAAVGGAVVAVVAKPALKELQDGGAEIAKQAAQKAVRVAKNVIKK